MTAVEFRIRSGRVPRDLFPDGSVRFLLGHATTKREIAQLEAHKQLLQRLARQGDWPLLRAVKDKKVTPEEIEVHVTRHGFDMAHRLLRAKVRPPTLGPLVEEWLTTLNSRTGPHYRHRIAHLLRWFGPGHSILIGEHEIDALIRDQQKRYAPNTVAGARTAWSAFFTWFIARDRSEAKLNGRDPLLQANPVRGASVDTPTEAKRVRFLTRDELDALIDAAPPPMRAQYLTLAYCGLRIGEFQNLPPEHMAIPGYVRLAPHGSWAPKGYPRYSHGIRDVPIHREKLLPALETYRDEWAGDVTFFVNPRTFEPWEHGAFRAQLERDCTAAGIVYGQKQHGVTPHTFRHTLASWLAQADVQLLKIAALLGDTVATYYAHLLPSDLDETINQAL